jgi:hypothetical protein
METVAVLAYRKFFTVSAESAAVVMSSPYSKEP